MNNNHRTLFNNVNLINWVGLLFVVCLLIGFGRPAVAESFSPGSYIINMGVTPQTDENGLRPYGLVYKLVNELNIPVYWTINSTKSRDGIDFTVDGINFAGGPFVIPAEFAAQAATAIASAVGDGVVVHEALSQFDAPPVGQGEARLITYIPNAVLTDSQVENAFYDKSGIPDSAFRRKGDPFEDQNADQGGSGGIGVCEDVVGIPHDDPSGWSTAENNRLNCFIDIDNSQGKLPGGASGCDNIWSGAGGAGPATYTRATTGHLWAGCHSPSEIENRIGWNFLTNVELLDRNDHSDNRSSSIVYPEVQVPDIGRVNAQPIMQSLGEFHDALVGGSEEVYLPDTNGWRDTTFIGVFDNDKSEVNSGTSSGEAAFVAFGRGYGEPDNGIVVYESSHDFSKGSEAEDVAAARVYGNFLIEAGLDLALELSSTIPSTIAAGAAVQLQASAVGGTGVYTFAWQSDCNGTFDNASIANPVFTAPVGAANCTITVAVDDSCQRSSFIATPISISNQNLSIFKLGTNTACPGDTISYLLLPGMVDSTIPSTNLCVFDTAPFLATTFLSASPPQTAPGEWCLGSNAPASDGVGTASTVSMSAMPFLVAGTADVTIEMDVTLQGFTAVSAALSVSPPSAASLVPTINGSVTVNSCSGPTPLSAFFPVSNSASGHTETFTYTCNISAPATVPNEISWSTPSSTNAGFSFFPTFNSNVTFAPSTSNSVLVTTPFLQFDAQVSAFVSAPNTITNTASIDDDFQLLATSNVVTTDVPASCNVVPPVAVNDEDLNNVQGDSVTLNLPANDSDTDGVIVNSTVQLIAIPGSTLSGDGKTLIVASEGTWNVNGSGMVTFTPLPTFAGNPTIIEYTIEDDDSLVSNRATITVTYLVQIPPICVDDQSLGNLCPTVCDDAIFNIFNNDSDGDGSIDLSSYILDETSVGGTCIFSTAQGCKAVELPGIGIWRIFFATGILFEPDPAYDPVVNGLPPLIEYTMQDDQGNVCDPATIEIHYVGPPIANDNVSFGHLPFTQANFSSPISDDDVVTDLSRAIDPSTIDLKPTSVGGVCVDVTSSPNGECREVQVPNEGTWIVDGLGNTTFSPCDGVGSIAGGGSQASCSTPLVGNPQLLSYSIKDLLIGGTPGVDPALESNQATLEVNFLIPPTANPDVSLVNTDGQPVTLDANVNDTDTDGVIDGSTFDFDETSVPAGVCQTFSGADCKQVLVPSEGVWSVDSLGIVTFSPCLAAGNPVGCTGVLVGSPEVIDYVVDDDDGLESNVTTITITYNSSTLSNVSIVKTASTTTVEECDDFFYDLTVSNSGPATAVGVVVTDVIPSSFTFDTTTVLTGGAVCSFASPPTLSCTLSDILVGAQTIIRVGVKAGIGCP